MRKLIHLVAGITLALGTLGSLGIASAEESDDDSDDKVEKEQFRQTCGDLGGTYGESDKLGVDHWTCDFDNDDGSGSHHECWTDFDDSGDIAHQNCGWWSTHELPEPDGRRPQGPAGELPEEAPAATDGAGGEGPPRPGGPAQEAPEDDAPAPPDGPGDGPGGPGSQGPGGPAQQVPEDADVIDDDGEASGSPSRPRPRGPVGGLPAEPDVVTTD